VNQFRKLSKQITQGNKQAQSNLKFLKLLDKPCKKLAKSHPSQIPDQLDDIIMFIRFIWTNSEFYNTRERLTSLFRKLSNEIIRICSINIDLDKIFNGHIVTSKTSVQACIFALQTWKGKYKYAQKVHHKFSDFAWVLDQSSIFAQIDAFIQRCKDLLEICECQKHFARWQDGEKIRLPIFHGQRGPEMARSLLEIEETFTKHVRVLEEAKQSILNVKQTLWHDSFTRFRNSVKDLEVMVQILLTSAFDSHQTIHNYVHVLEIFEHFSVRESIRRELDKKTKDMWFMFTEEVNRVKRLLAAKRPNLTENQPKFSGSAQWAKLLKRRVERPMALLERASVFLPKTGSGEEAKNSYNNLIAALDDFIRTMFQEWSGTV
jgi:dynein heavy chain